MLDSAHTPNGSRSCETGARDSESLNAFGTHSYLTSVPAVGVDFQPIPSLVRVEGTQLTHGPATHGRAARTWHPGLPLLKTGATWRFQESTHDYVFILC